MLNRLSDETLHILGPGSVAVPAAPGGNTLILNITGDLIMDILSEISGDVTGAGAVGANITVNATRDIVLNGNGGSGARVTSNQTAGSCTTGQAGNVTLRADSNGDLDGDVTIADGAVVSVNGRCPAGEIIITGVNITIAGLVESRSSNTGARGAQRPGGGPITIDATCSLIITGTVSSSGKDAGADLVHLEGGCVVRILGLVESTGAGHGPPTNPPNHCNNVNRPDKPANSTACVEVWAGDSLVIDSTPPNAGQINADTGGPGGAAGTSWVDLFAHGPIEIIGDTSGPFAVHANGLAGSNDDGGDITVKSVADQVTATNRALQADATRPGGAGGSLIVQAAAPVTLNTASLFAQGDANPVGGLGIGGIIAGRSFNGALNWQNGDGDVEPIATGSIALTACGAISTAGTDFHGEVPVLAALCGGAPTLPVYVILPTCLCPIPPPGLPPDCPGDSHGAARPLTSAVAPPGTIMGVPSFTTLQAAVNAAGLDEVIGMFTNTTENVIIDDAKRLFITKCTLGQVTAANPAIPVIDISSTDTIIISGLDTRGGTIGFLVETNGHQLRGVRATNASVAGISILGNNNSVSFNSLANSGAGLLVSGDVNDIRGGTVEKNLGNGVQVTATGDNNTFRGAKVLTNGGNGILVQGSGNTVRDNGQVDNNSLDGINVTGVGNKLRSDRASANTGDEFDIGPGNVNQGGNKANGVTCTFGAGGGVCN